MHADILSGRDPRGCLRVSPWKGQRCGRIWTITRKLYGKRLENREIVTTAVRTPNAAAKLLALLNRYSAKERTN